MSKELQLNRMFKGATFFFIGIVISKFLSYLYRFYAARMFGPEIYGLFSIGLATISFAGIIGMLGLNAGVKRFVPEYLAKGDKKGVKGVIASSLRMSLSVSTVIAILLILASPWLSGALFGNTELAVFLQIMAISIPLNSLMYICVSAFIGFKNVKYQVYVENLMFNLTKLLLVVVLGLFVLNPVNIPVSFTLGTALSALLGFYLLEKRTFSVISNEIRERAMRTELLRFSLPLVLTGFMGVIFLWIDSFMIGLPSININSLNTIADVGIYNSAMPTAQFLLIVPVAFTSLFIPIITEFFTKRMKFEMEKVYKVVTRWIFYVNFPFFLLMLLFSDNVLIILWGGEFVSGQGALMVLSAGFMLMSLTQTPLNMLHVLKKTKTWMYISIANAGFNIVLNLLLIPPLGILGGAIATTLTYLLNLILALLTSHSTLKAHPFSWGILKSMVAGIASIALTYALAVAFFIPYTIGIIVVLFFVFIVLYSLMLAVLRGFEKEDIDILASIERRSGLKIRFLRDILKRFV